MSVGVLKHRETTVYRAVESSVRPDVRRRPKVVEHVAGAHQFLPDHLTGAEVERGEVVQKSGIDSDDGRSAKADFLVLRPASAAER